MWEGSFDLDAVLSAWLFSNQSHDWRFECALSTLHMCW